MKIKDFLKEGNSKFEPKNPKIIQNSKTKYYTIEYDAVYEDGHIEKHTGFGSKSPGVIKEYLKTYFEINDNLILRLRRADNMFVFYDYGVSQNCNNPDSFGEVCVKCGNCGRIFDECGKCSNISEFPAEEYEEE